MVCFPASQMAMQKYLPFPGMDFISEKVLFAADNLSVGVLQHAFWPSAVVYNILLVYVPLITVSPTTFSLVTAPYDKQS